MLQYFSNLKKNLFLYWLWTHLLNGDNKLMKGWLYHQIYRDLEHFSKPFLFLNLSFLPTFNYNIVVKEFLLTGPNFCTTL